MFRYSVIKVQTQKMSQIKSTSGWSISRILSSGSLRLCSHLSGQRVTTLLGAAYPGLTETSSLPSSVDDFTPA